MFVKELSNNIFEEMHHDYIQARVSRRSLRDSLKRSVQRCVKPILGGAHTKRRFTKRRFTKRRFTKRRFTKRRQDKTST
jgi:hypothetical protein